ncbi:MAG: hypothetical protein WA194_04665 [Patescibacteria group bacterium]
MKKSFLLPALAVPFLLASCGQPGDPGADRPVPPQGGSGATLDQRQAPSATDGASQGGAPSSYNRQKQADTKTSAS